MRRLHRDESLAWARRRGLREIVWAVVARMERPETKALCGAGLGWRMSWEPALHYSLPIMTLGHDRI